MLIKNTSKRLIAIGAVRIAPGCNAEVADSFVEHPVVKAYINKGELATAGAVKKLVEKQPVEEADEKSAEKTKPIDKMTKKELEAYAAENGIDTTGAKTNDDLKALIMAQVNIQHKE